MTNYISREAALMKLMQDGCDDFCSYGERRDGGGSNDVSG